MCSCAWGWAVAYFPPLEAGGGPTGPHKGQAGQEDRPVCWPVEARSHETVAGRQAHQT